MIPARTRNQCRLGSTCFEERSDCRNGLDEVMKVRGVADEHRRYLLWHRRVFRGTSS